MEQNYDNSFLARWLTNDLNDEELKQFQKTDEYKQYHQIIETLNTASFPHYDVDSNFEATLKKINKQPISNLRIEKKPKIYTWFYTAAASVLLCIGYTFLPSKRNNTYRVCRKQNF